MLSARPSRLDADARAVLHIRPGGEPAAIATLSEMLMTETGDRAGDLAPFAAALREGRSAAVLVSVDVLRSPHRRKTLEQLGTLLQTLRGLGKDPALQFLFDRANQLGAWDMGVLPGVLPGLRPLADASARAALEAAWGGAEIPSDPGMDLDAMLEHSVAGKLGALYIVGCDPLMSYPDREFVRAGLDAAGLVIVQDTFFTDTAGVADIVLPASGYGEEAGTFTNNEGRVQAVRKFREPAFEARGNLAIFDFVARLKDRPIAPANHDAIFDEIARLIPAYGQLSAGTLGEDGVFSKASPAPYACEATEPPSGPVPGESLMLITGNGLFHNGYATERSEILNTVADEAYVEMSAADAADLGLADQDDVIVQSAQAELKAQLKVNRRFPAGLVFVPENYRSLRLNSLLRRGQYPCPVKVRKVAAAVRAPVVAPAENPG